MRIIQIFRVAVTNLKSNGVRSLLTIAGISVGIGAIVFLVSLGYGLQKMSTEKIASIEAINTLDVSTGGKGGNQLTPSLMAEAEEWSEVEKISPMLSLGGKAMLGEKKTDTVINVVSAAYFAMEGTKTDWGGLFADDGNDIVISTGLVKAFATDSDQMLNQELKLDIIIPSDGDEEKTEKFAFNIIGVVQDDSSTFIYLPLSALKEDLPESTVYNSLKVKVRAQEQLGAVREKLSGMGFKVTSIADTIDQVNRIFSIIQIVLALFGMIALLVAAIGMFNTMTIALLERTRDIGIMKSVGVRNRDVYRMFLVEAVLIASTGGIFGVLVGHLTARVTNYLINSLAVSVGGEAQLLFYTPLWFAVTVIIFAIVVGVSTGFYPSRRASRLNPLDALRYE